MTVIPPNGRPLLCNLENCTEMQFRSSFEAIEISSINKISACLNLRFDDQINASK